MDSKKPPPPIKPTEDYKSYKFEERASKLEYEVTRLRQTEPPFDNKFFNHCENGLYCCICCGVPLFDSRHKFKCASGWPSFTRSILPNLTLSDDFEHGMARIEVQCPNDDCHLGHLFHDGPPPRNTRYCINSVSLRFKPRNECSEYNFQHDNGYLVEDQINPSTKHST